MEEACRKGDVDAVRILVSKNPSLVSSVDSIGITPLHRAAGGNHLLLAKFLIASKADVNVVDRYQDAPLKKAAYNGHADMVMLLVKSGASVNHRDGGGKIALHHSSEQGQLQSVEAMVDFGAEVDSVASGGLTPLHLAAANGHSWCCKALLVAKAYVDARGGQQKTTALHLASEGGHKHTVRLLIAERADMSIKDSQLRPPHLMAKDPATRAVFESPFVKSMCHGPSCTAEGPGVLATPRADDACLFIIQPRDRYGVPLRDDGGLLNFTVDVYEDESGRLVPARVIPNSRMGNAVCYYDGSKTGKYNVHVYLEDFKNEGDTRPGRRVQIGGSPYRVGIKASPLDTYATRATGPGVTSSYAGHNTVFTVHGRDRFQNPSPGGELSVVISPLNRSPRDLRIEDSANGDYLVSYTAPVESGTYILSVTLGGKRHIYNSPFTVFVNRTLCARGAVSVLAPRMKGAQLQFSPRVQRQSSGVLNGTVVLPGPVHPPMCSASGRGLVSAGKNLPARFTVHIADAFGNSIVASKVPAKVRVRALPLFVDQDPDIGTDEGVEEQEPSMQRPDDSLDLSFATSDGAEEEQAEEDDGVVSHEIFDYGNGVCTVEYIPRRAGLHEVVIEIGDTMLGGKPYTPMVSELPEWEVEEVAIFIQRIGFPEYARNFAAMRIDGTLLAGLSLKTLETELHIHNKSHQRSLLHYIGHECQTAFDPSSIVRVDDLSLAQLGVLDTKARQRVTFMMTETSEKTSEATEREEAFQSLLNKRLGATGHALQDSLRVLLEDILADTTDTLLTDWNNGKVDAASLTQSLKALEKELKTQFTLDVRQAVIAHAGDVGGAGDQLRQRVQEAIDGGRAVTALRERKPRTWLVEEEPEEEEAVAASAEAEAEGQSSEAEPPSDDGDGPASAAQPSQEAASPAQPAQEPPTSAAEPAQEPPASAAQPAQEQPASAARSAQEPPTSAAQLAQEPPTSAAQPAQEQPASATESAQEPPASAAQPAQEPPASAAQTAQEPPASTTEPVQEPPASAAQPTQEPPASAARSAQEPPVSAAKTAQEAPVSATEPAQEPPASAAQTAQEPRGDGRSGSALAAAAAGEHESQRVGAMETEEDGGGGASARRGDDEDQGGGARGAETDGASAVDEARASRASAGAAEAVGVEDEGRDTADSSRVAPQQPEAAADSSSA